MKDIEVQKLNEVKISLETKNSSMSVELQALKIEVIKKGNKNDQFHCTTCSFETENLIKLKHHVMKTHCNNKGSQVEECPSQVNYFSLCETDKSTFCEYLCFYCETNIISDDHLQEHKTKCQDNSIVYPCEQCSAKCTDGGDLKRHRTTYHELGTWCHISGKELFWCDVCPLNYESKIELEFHRRGFH